MLNLRSKSTFLASTMISALLGAGVSAHAAEAPAAGGAAEDSAYAEGEIIVTGEKQQTTLQRAPLAITAISADTLAQSNITQLIDMNGFVPGLTIANSGSFVRVVSIRGVGYEASDNLSAQPGTLARALCSEHRLGVGEGGPFGEVSLLSGPLVSLRQEEYCLVLYKLHLNSISVQLGKGVNTRGEARPVH